MLPWIGWLYSTWMMVLSGTLVALGNGLAVSTCAAVLASDPAIVNWPLKLLRGTPEALWAEESRKTWIRSPALNEAAGVNWIAWPLLKVWRAPETTTPLSVTCSAPAMVPTFMAALVKRVTSVLAGTLVAPLPGRMATTDGVLPESAVVSVNWLLVFAKAFPERS